MSSNASDFGSGAYAERDRPGRASYIAMVIQR